MPDPRISEDTILRTSELANAVEDMREAAAQEAKDLWADFREELKALGLKGSEISAEVSQFKAAVAEKRMNSEDRAKADAKSEGKDGYLAIINGPRARARTRGNEPQVAPRPAQADAQSVSSPSVENEGAAISTPIQPETANDVTPLTTKGGSDESETTHPVSVSDPGRRHRTDEVEDRIHEVANTSAQTAAGEGALNAPAAPKYAAPGIVKMESTPPEPVKWHPYANCFPTVLGDDLLALEKAIHERFGGVEKPIVKIGNLILDGRARYGIARSMMIDYPVVQYGGTDALMDVIALNLASRNMTAAQRKETARKLAKLEPDRTIAIFEAMGIEAEVAA